MFGPGNVIVGRRLRPVDRGNVGVTWPKSGDGSPLKALTWPKDSLGLLVPSVFKPAEEEVHICEGETDLLAAVACGLNAVATPGTACKETVLAALREAIGRAKRISIHVQRDREDEDGSSPAIKWALGILREIGAGRCDVRTLPEGYEDFADAHERGEDPMALETEISGEAFLRDHGADPDGAELDVIRVNSRQLREIEDDCWAAIAHHNAGAPQVFVRNGEPIVLDHRRDGPVLRVADVPLVRGHLTRIADFVAVTSGDGCSEVKAARPPRDVIETMVSRPRSDLPEIDGVVTTPILGRDGRLLTTEGYNLPNRVYAHLGDLKDLPAIAERPTGQEVRDAVALLSEEMMGEFPFVAEADRSHALALLLLLFVRRVIAGPTPLHDIEAPVAGSGKGLLTDVFTILAAGRASDPTTLPTTDDGVRNKITALLRQGRQLIVLDNGDQNRGQIHSPSLASVLTAVNWTDRQPHAQKVLTLPNRAVWAFTGNNPRFTSELARRCIRIRLDAKVDRPWQRQGFRHPKLRVWAKEERRRLVTAALTIIQAWVAEGMPEDSEANLGSFEDWAGKMGGILQVAGVGGFLGNVDELYESADAEGQALREFFAFWWEHLGDKSQRVCRLNDLCDEHDLMTAVRGDGQARSQQTRLGRALAAVRDRVIGDVRLEAKQGRTKSLEYSLVRVEVPDFPDMSGTCPAPGPAGPTDVSSDQDEGVQDLPDLLP
jgi:hypothetical protein